MEVERNVVAMEVGFRMGVLLVWECGWDGGGCGDGGLVEMEV